MGDITHQLLPFLWAQEAVERGGAASLSSGTRELREQKELGVGSLGHVTHEKETATCIIDSFVE